MRPYAIGLLFSALLSGLACTDAPPASQRPAARVQHILLLSNTERADSLATLLRSRLAAQPTPARLSDLSRREESLTEIYARLPWALQQGVDVFVLDLEGATTEADTLPEAIERLVRQSNPAARILGPDALDQAILFGIEE